MKLPVSLFMAILLTIMVCCACKGSMKEAGEINRAAANLMETGSLQTDEGLLRSNTITIPYGSRKEIEDVFELASADEGTERYFSDYGILVINGYLLGGYNDRWIAWEELFPMMPEEDTYKIYVEGQYKGVDIQDQKIY